MAESEAPYRVGVSNCVLSRSLKTRRTGHELSCRATKKILQGTTFRANGGSHQVFRKCVNNCVSKRMLKHKSYREVCATTSLELVQLAAICVVKTQI